MSLDNVLSENIHFSASPSRDQLITLTIGQLQDLIKEAVQPLQDEISDLKATIANQGEKITALESTEEQDVTRICLDIALDRKRIAALEHKEPQPLQKDRAEILRALVVANGGKMLAKDARQKMHLKENQFSELLATCDFLTLKPYHLDNRKKVIILKSELVQ